MTVVNLAESSGASSKSSCPGLNATTFSLGEEEAFLACTKVRKRKKMVHSIQLCLAENHLEIMLVQNLAFSFLLIPHASEIIHPFQLKSSVKDCGSDFHEDGGKISTE